MTLSDVTPDGDEAWPTAAKTEVAARLAKRIADALMQETSA